MKTKQAFTLIELLVVIAIIGILATVSVVAFQNARAKSRDAKRVADVKQIQTALELYFNDMNRYPTTAEFSANGLSSTSTLGTTTYMTNVPSAPTPADGTCSNSDNSFYYTSVDGSSYVLSFCIGGSTGSLQGGINTISPAGIAYGGAGTGGGTSACACDNAAAPCCNNCDPADATCQGGDYCARDANCPIGQFCNLGSCSSWACGNPIAYSGGPYDSNGTTQVTGGYYRTININGQCWLKDNLNIGTENTTGPQTNNSIIEKYCFEINPANCVTQGGIYQWNEAMQYSTTEGAQGICPSGWHIPTDAQQYALENYLKDSGQSCVVGRSGWDCDTAGTKLRSGGSSGFGLSMAGYYNTNGSFYNQGVYGGFWSSSISGVSAWFRLLSVNYTTIDREYYNQSFGFSVRCLKD